MPTLKAEEATELKTFIVAKGRSVSHQPTKDDDVVHYGPNDEIELPAKEGNRLQKLGFLLFDDGSSLVPTGGPATETGVEIKEVE